MTPEEAVSLIAKGETLTVEFKRGRAGDMTDEAIVEAAVCLANGFGGVLFLGVANDGTIDGLDPRHGRVTDPGLLEAMIKDHTKPRLKVHVEVLELDGVPVAAVHVPRKTRPIGTLAGHYARRALTPEGEPQCIPFGQLPDDHPARRAQA